MVPSGSPGGAGRPGRRGWRSVGALGSDPAAVGGAPSPRDDGAVTVEAAFALMGLLVVVGALAWVLALVGAQLAVGESARAAARVAARGEPVSATVAEARRLVHDAQVDVRVDGDHVVVDVSREVTLPGTLARWGSVRLEAESVAATEPRQ
jgi:hypothetical protein